MPNRLVAIVIAAIAASACSHSGGGASAQASPSAPPRVKTLVSDDGAVQPRISVPGMIVPYQTVGVSSALSEPVVRVNVQEGDVVRAGHVLAILETDDLQASLAAARRVVNENAARTAQTAYGARAAIVQGSTDVVAAQANVRSAVVNLASAQNDLRRDETLSKQGYLAAQTADQQRTVVASDAQALSSARATLAAAEASRRANGDQAAGEQAAQVTAAREAEASAAESAREIERQMARATIVAPVDGTVMSVNANPGEYPSGRQLFTLERNSSVYALLSATDDDAFTVRPGAKALVTPHGTRGTVSGFVTAVLDQIQPGSTNFSIKVLLQNPDRALHAGMPVTATVFSAPVRGVRVPLTAFADDNRNAVWIVKDGVVHSQTVSERADDGTYAVVSGLTHGTRVVTAAQESGVADGDRVTI